MGVTSTLEEAMEEYKTKNGRDPTLVVMSKTQTIKYLCENQNLSYKDGKSLLHKMTREGQLLVYKGIPVLMSAYAKDEIIVTDAPEKAD